MKKELKFRIVVSLLTVAAFMLLLAGQFGLFSRKYQASQTTFAASIQDNADYTPPKEVKRGKPLEINISSVSINLPVYDGQYDEKNKTWTLSTNAAHYALITALPNNVSGNTFIYGHNRKEVFSRLAGMKVGDRATITTDSGYTFVYRFRKSIETNPYDDSLFRYEGPPILTLQTCSGLWYQNRQLFTFDLVEVTKS